jgi:uncharacterized protein (TIGR02466 family)
MPIRAWFPTYLYCEPLQKSGTAKLNLGLTEECRRLRDFDTAGRKSSAKNYPGGYTSYASMNELHRFSSTFAELEKSSRATPTPSPGTSTWTSAGEMCGSRTSG